MGRTNRNYAQDSALTIPGILAKAGVQSIKVQRQSGALKERRVRQARTAAASSSSCLDDDVRAGLCGLWLDATSMTNVVRAPANKAYDKLRKESHDSSDSLGSSTSGTGAQLQLIAAGQALARRLLSKGRRLLSSKRQRGKSCSTTWAGAVSMPSNLPASGQGLHTQEHAADEPAVRSSADPAPGLSPFSAAPTSPFITHAVAWVPGPAPPQPQVTSRCAARSASCELPRQHAAKSGLITLSLRNDPLQPAPSQQCTAPCHAKAPSSRQACEDRQALGDVPPRRSLPGQGLAPRHNRAHSYCQPRAALDACSTGGEAGSPTAGCTADCGRSLGSRHEAHVAWMRNRLRNGGALPRTPAAAASGPDCAADDGEIKVLTLRDLPTIASVPAAAAAAPPPWPISPPPVVLSSETQVLLLPSADYSMDGTGAPAGGKGSWSPALGGPASLVEICKPPSQLTPCASVPVATRPSPQRAAGTTTPLHTKAGVTHTACVSPAHNVHMPVAAVAVPAPVQVHARTAHGEDGERPRGRGLARVLDKVVGVLERVRASHLRGSSASSSSCSRGRDDGRDGTDSSDTTPASAHGRAPLAPVQGPAPHGPPHLTAVMHGDEQGSWSQPVASNPTAPALPSHLPPDTQFNLHGSCASPRASPLHHLMVPVSPWMGGTRAVTHATDRRTSSPAVRATPPRAATGSPTSGTTQSSGNSSVHGLRVRRSLEVEVAHVGATASVRTWAPDWALRGTAGMFVPLDVHATSGSLPLPVRLCTTMPGMDACARAPAGSAAVPDASSTADDVDPVMGDAPAGPAAKAWPHLSRISSSLLSDLCSEEVERANSGLHPAQLQYSVSPQEPAAMACVHRASVQPSWAHPVGDGGAGVGSLPRSAAPLSSSCQGGCMSEEGEENGSEYGDDLLDVVMRRSLEVQRQQATSASPQDIPSIDGLVAKELLLQAQAQAGKRAAVTAPPAKPAAAIPVTAGLAAAAPMSARREAGGVLQAVVRAREQEALQAERAQAVAGVGCKADKALCPTMMRDELEPLPSYHFSAASVPSSAYRTTAGGTSGAVVAVQFERSTPVEVGGQRAAASTAIDSGLVLIGASSTASVLSSPAHSLTPEVPVPWRASSHMSTMGQAPPPPRAAFVQQALGSRQAPVTAVRYNPATTVHQAPVTAVRKGPAGYYVPVVNEACTNEGDDAHGSWARPAPPAYAPQKHTRPVRTTEHAFGVKLDGPGEELKGAGEVAERRAPRFVLHASDELMAQAQVVVQGARAGGVALTTANVARQEAEHTKAEARRGRACAPGQQYNPAVHRQLYDVSDMGFGSGADCGYCTSGTAGTGAACSDPVAGRQGSGGLLQCAVSDCGSDGASSGLQPLLSGAYPEGVHHVGRAHAARSLGTRPEGNASGVSSGEGGGGVHQGGAASTAACHHQGRKIIRLPHPAAETRHMSAPTRNLVSPVMRWLLTGSMDCNMPWGLWDADLLGMGVEEAECDEVGEFGCWEPPPPPRPIEQKQWREHHHQHRHQAGRHMEGGHASRMPRSQPTPAGIPTGVTTGKVDW